MALGEVEQQWANLRAGPKALTEREAHEMAAVYHDRRLCHDADNPNEQTVWCIEVYPSLWQTPQSVSVENVLSSGRDKMR